MENWGSIFMPKYNSFTEYLQDNYSNQIKESLLEFVNENGVRNDEGVVIYFDKYEIAHYVQSK